MKFDKILVYCIANISTMFWLNAGDLKLVPGPFMILLKWQNSWKRFLKIIALVYIYQLAKFDDLMSCGSKDVLKNAPCLVY